PTVGCAMVRRFQLYLQLLFTRSENRIFYPIEVTDYAASFCFGREPCAKYFARARPRVGRFHESPLQHGAARVGLAADIGAAAKAPSRSGTSFRCPARRPGGSQAGRTDRGRQRSVREF